MWNPQKAGYLLRNILGSKVVKPNLKEDFHINYSVTSKWFTLIFCYFFMKGSSETFLRSGVNEKFAQFYVTVEKANGSSLLTPPSSRRHGDKIASGSKSGSVDTTLRIEEVVDLSSEVDFEVDGDDFQELLGSNNQELTTEELKEMHKKKQ
ncbi:hypothetical protein TNCV_3674461 [Trichonephila clavipes]|nr:hypothetical protein TNCV_3674461 [Trichonephila clavipes]